jgi:cytochrome c-type biogenesis protein
MGIGSIALAFAAGTLSILSPCTLPIIPIVLGAAATDGKGGPFALAAGLAMSFVTIGLFVAVLGHEVGLDEDVFRNLAAVLMLAVGLVLALPRLQTQLAAVSGPIANWADHRFGTYRERRLPQFGMGLLLGAVWSPCVGPTLGAASLLAAQGRDLLQVGIIMLAFGLGAALPLLALGIASREALARWRGKLLSAGSSLKASLGILFVAIGLLVLTGLDRSIETVLVNASPQWLTNLTTRL